MPHHAAKGPKVSHSLTEAQIAAYEKDGVVFPLTAFDAAQAAAYRTALVRDCAEAERPVSDAGIRQPSTRVKSYLLFPWAAELIRHPSILDAVSELIGPDILAFHSTVWSKPAGSAGRVPWHQDGTYFGLAPFEHVTAWVALTPSTPQSGCVQVLPGSHRAGQRAHVDQKDPSILLSRGQSIKDPVDEARAVPIILQPGQFSLHHTMVLHNSQPNRSDDDRIGIGISFIPTRVRHIGETRLAASLVRGTDRYGHFDLEPAPLASADPAAMATHGNSLDRFWRAAESIPEMAMVH
jgi:non-heme Fe2+,alpha-ketoglutarate-dependent halogenase